MCRIKQEYHLISMGWSLLFYGWRFFIWIKKLAYVFMILPHIFIGHLYVFLDLVSFLDLLLSLFSFLSLFRSTPCSSQNFYISYFCIKYCLPIFWYLTRFQIFIDIILLDSLDLSLENRCFFVLVCWLAILEVHPLFYPSNS